MNCVELGLGGRAGTGTGTGAGLAAQPEAETTRRARNARLAGWLAEPGWGCAAKKVTESVGGRVVSRVVFSCLHAP